MTSNPNPQQNKFGNAGQTQSNRPDATQGNRPDATQGSRQDAAKGQGAGETHAFGGIRGGVEQSPSSEKGTRGSQDRSGSQDIERCLAAIEENCQKLRQALSSSASSSDTSRSESSDSSRTSGSQDRGNTDRSNPSSGNQAGRTSR